MKKQNFNTLEIVDLKKELQSTQKKLADISFVAKTSRPKNTKEVSLLRKNIARILTAMTKKQNA